MSALEFAVMVWALAMAGALGWRMGRTELEYLIEGGDYYPIAIRTRVRDHSFAMFPTLYAIGWRLKDGLISLRYAFTPPNANVECSLCGNPHPFNTLTRYATVRWHRYYLCPTCHLEQTPNFPPEDDDPDDHDPATCQLCRELDHASQLYPSDEEVQPPHCEICEAPCPSEDLQWIEVALGFPSTAQACPTCYQKYTGYFGPGEKHEPTPTFILQRNWGRTTTT